MKANVYVVKPSEKGLKVPHPDNAQLHLSEEGELVEWNSYWQRRLDAKEVVRSEAPKEVTEKTNHKEASKVEKEHKAKDQGGN